MREDIVVKDLHSVQRWLLFKHHLEHEIYSSSIYDIFHNKGQISNMLWNEIMSLIWDQSGYLKEIELNASIIALRGSDKNETLWVFCHYFDS